MTYVFDTHAWIEYFYASSAGKTVDEILKNTKDIYAPSIVIAEMKKKILWEMRSNKASFATKNQMMDFIKLNSYVIDLDCELAEKAAELTDELSIERKGFGLADGIVLATTKKLNAKLVTGDNHFCGMNNVIFLK